jgi:nucleoid-associated protein YgaU
MPVGPTSRYRLLPVALEPDAVGVAHPAIPARRLPPEDPTATTYFHTVVASETIELLAFRYFGTGTAWWLIADANPTAFPLDLAPGTVLAIPADASPGRVERTRSF